jgi:MYXO-CTERM domain-containing protein
LVAVDAAGNESAPQTVRIHDDMGGCSIGRRSGVKGGTLAMLVLALVLAGRRRRCA